MQDKPNPMQPRNRAERRRLAKAYKGFKPKSRMVWRTMNKHMKEARLRREAEQQENTKNGA